MMMIPPAAAVMTMRNKKKSKVLYHKKTIPAAKADRMTPFPRLLHRNHQVHLMHLPTTVIIPMRHQFKMMMKKKTIQSWITNKRRNNMSGMIRRRCRPRRQRMMLHLHPLKLRIYLPYLLPQQQHHHQMTRKHIHLNQQPSIHQVPPQHLHDYLVFGQASRVHQDAGRLNNNNSSHPNKRLWLLSIMKGRANDFLNNIAVLQSLILVMKIYWHKWKISTLPIQVIPKYGCWWASNVNL